MDITGQKVSHKTLGVGIITWFGEKNQVGAKYIEVEFESKKTEFAYPVCFEKFLIALDETFEEFVSRELNLHKENLKIKEDSPKIEQAPLRTAHTQHHKPTLYCAINTFVFKNTKGFNRGVYGYETYDKSGRKVGITYKHKQRAVASGQAEISFFEEYKDEFGEWRLVFIDGDRLPYEKLSKILEKNDAFEAEIAPRKGS